MSTTIERTATYTVTIPAGEYWVGDPGYIIDDDTDWQTWVNATYTGDHREARIAPVSGHVVIAFDTHGGDGDFPASDGRTYPVDAGLLGLVPVAYRPDFTPRELRGNLTMRKVTFIEDTDATVLRRNHTVNLGHLRIPTTAGPSRYWD